MSEQIKTRIQEDWSAPGFKVWFYRDRSEFQIEVICGDIVKTFDRGSELPPSIILDRSAISEFLNEAQRLGFNQEKIKESQSVLDAKNAHLEDMRHLVFKEARHE